MSGEGEYNLNILKEIAVTNSFLELGSDEKKCQSYESKGSYDNCTTKYFSEQMKKDCGCLPYDMNNATFNDIKVCGICF